MPGFRDTFKLWQVIRNLNDLFDSGSNKDRLVKASDDDFDFEWAGSYPQSTLESNNSITPTDESYEWGNVFRYGAVADSDSATTTQGTDNTAAFQKAVDSGHPVYVPEGDYSIEGTVNIDSDGAVAGGKTVTFNSQTRCERYTSATVPMFHIWGVQNYINGQGAQIAARSGGGFDKGLVLMGPDPEIADNTATSAAHTAYNYFGNFKIIGKTSNTGWDGSIGLFLNSAARRRGEFVTPTALACYWNHIENILSTQWDYCFGLTTDCNINHFDSCKGINFGHAAFWCAGATNQFINCSVETASAQDSTERYAWHWANANTGIESNFAAAYATNEDVDVVGTAITGITKGSTTTITTSTAHGLSVGNKVLIEGVVDNGPGGDLETPLEYSHWEVLTVPLTTTFTIQLDSSGFTNNWSSGGTVKDNVYPVWGAHNNRVVGHTELSNYSTSTRKIRLIGCTEPNGAYAAGDEYIWNGTWGENITDVRGPLGGGVGPGGISTTEVLLNNIVYNDAVYKHGKTQQDFMGFWFKYNNDFSGTSFGTNEFKIYSDRTDNLSSSTTYDLITIDNVGPTSASITINLSFCGKEGSGNDQEGGEISWLCSVTSSTARTPIKYKDLQANENASAYTFSVAASSGTDANTGKFILQVTTSSASGSFYLSWKVELLSNNLEGTNLDWDDDVTVQNGA